MAVQTIATGAYLFEKDQPLDSFQLIVDGQVSLFFPGGELTLEKGDVVGLLDLVHDTHSFSYKATTDTSYISYDYSADQPLTNVFAENEELANLFALSMFKQVCVLLNHYEKSKDACNRLYQYLVESYGQYPEFCTNHKISPKVLPGFENAEPLTLEDDIENWLSSYYANIINVISGGVPAFLSKNPNILFGLMTKASYDVQDTLTVCQMLSDYRSDISVLLMEENHIDLFDLYSNLLFRIGPNTEDGLAIMEVLADMRAYLEYEPSVSKTLLSERITEFETKLQQKAEAGTDTETFNASTQDITSLTGSLDTILDYAGCEAELNTKFTKLIADFKKLIDKSGTDDKSRRLRMEITKLFYQIYERAFLRSLDEPTVPDIIMMFFQFGYMDEELAGMENAAYLRSLVQDIPSDPSRGVYSIYDWLCAIYRGEKEPCRNEFDADYTAFIHEMKVSGKITEAKERALLQDKKGKVAFEIENMFQLVNRMTFGRISTFCPVFSEHNILKDLPKALVTADLVADCFQNIRSTDYSAFCRETIYTNPKLGIGKEMVQVEVLPDVILMPNVGIRGVMWQEIEGKKRTTPSRMMLSLFQLEDLETILVKLTGEFRWEMCRRIQGARWNDLSERSLTSEYCDYIQFYKKNRDLSTEAKDKIKSALQKAKNNYKEMFVQDYISWIMYEGKGSPRLNKISRTILFSYCPFAKEVRTSLAANPQFREILERYKIKNVQKIHHLDNVEQKIRNMNGQIPPELVRQREFLES